MANSILSRFKRSWNIFFNKDPTERYYNTGPGYSYRADRHYVSKRSDNSILTSVENRIALDCASMDVMHIKTDEFNRFLKPMESTLNNCLTIEANIDQSGRDFIQDAVMSMLDEGCVAIVPVDFDDDPRDSDAYSIESIRTGQVLEWFPEHVKVRVYNDRKGIKEELIIQKRLVGLVENPLYSIMNEPNSTFQRLKRKLALLDALDEQSSSGKLDLIIQLPYVIKSEARRKQAEERRAEIENQLRGSKYGIAYTDGTEHITQLNRPVENNLMSQVEYLTRMLYSQLGITQEILDGTADETAMLNYYARTIDPILSSIVSEMKRKFLSKTARTQGQTIMYFRNPFRMVSISDLAEISDKFTRNEIATRNEIRQVIGWTPSDDPKADKLQNSNLYQDNGDNKIKEKGDENQNE